MKVTWRSLCLAVCPVLALPFTAQAAEQLHAPFRTRLPMATIASDDLGECKPVPKAVVSLATVSRYESDDPSKSSIDPKAMAAYEAAMKPLRDFQSEVVGWANDAVRRSRQIEKAGCAQIWMADWAKQSALTDLSTRQSEFNRDQALAAMALAYLQIAGVDTEGTVLKPAIVTWFRKLAEDVIRHYETEAGEMSRANNHRYFAALAVGAAGIAAQDTRLFDWAMTSFKTGVCSADRSGALPLEMRRGSRARDYQLFAAGPLVVLAEMAQANGIDAYGVCEGALHRIIDFGVTSIDDPSRIEELAGEKQIDMAKKDKRGSKLAWLVPYLVRFPNSPLADAIDGVEKLSSTALGGNQVVLYAMEEMPQ